MSKINEKEQRGSVGDYDRVRTIEIVISFVLIVIATVLLARMFNSEVIVNTTYDLELGVRLHPFNLGVQFSSLYGLTGAMLFFLAGCILTRGKNLHINVLCLTLYDLFMYPAILKNSRTYARLVLGYDDNAIWKVYNTNTVILILLGIGLIFLLVCKTGGRRGGVKKEANIIAVVLALMTCVDMILKAYINPWYIYFAVGLFVANLVVGKLYQVIVLRR